MQILKAALKPSMTALVIPFYLLLMFLTFFGTVLFAVEYDPTDAANSARVPNMFLS